MNGAWLADPDWHALAIGPRLHESPASAAKWSDSPCGTDDASGRPIRPTAVKFPFGSPILTFYGGPSPNDSKPFQRGQNLVADPAISRPKSQFASHATACAVVLGHFSACAFGLFAVVTHDLNLSPGESVQVLSETNLTSLPETSPAVGTRRESGPAFPGVAKRP